MKDLFQKILFFPQSFPPSMTGRCCNSCDDVREAYRRRGWAFKNADTIEQCRREGFTQKMQEQKNEGCQVYGVLEVNKVSLNTERPGKGLGKDSQRRTSSILTRLRIRETP